MVLKVSKPTDPAGLTLEAWAQGFMCGALIIMAAVAISNMRRHVLLHKLILVEVGITGVLHGVNHLHDIAHIWHVPICLHLPQRTDIWMVSIDRRNLSQCLLGTAQCHRLVEESSISRKEGVGNLHRYGTAFDTLLDPRDHSQLFVFQSAL